MTAPSFSDLRPVEMAALSLAASGLSNREIADRLGCVPGTVRNRLARAREVAGVTTERQLLAWHLYRTALHVAERRGARRCGA